MKNIESVPQLIEALTHQKKVALKDDNYLVFLSAEFWMSAPIILIIRSLAKKEVYVEE